MKLAIDLSVKARADLIEIAAYIARDNPSAADGLVSAAHLLFSDLADLPKLGRPFPVPGHRGLRRIPLHGYLNYNVYYMAHRESIEIVRILHAARQAKPILRSRS